MWPRIGESARLRIENKLLSAIRKGKVLPDGSTNEPLATWARDFLHVFASRDEAATILWLGLANDDAEKRHYVASFFFAQLPLVCLDEKQSKRAINAIADATRAKDQHIRTALLRYIDNFPDPWRIALVEKLADLTDSNNPARILADGTPFLTAEPETEFDDIPF